MINRFLFGLLLLMMIHFITVLIIKKLFPVSSNTNANKTSMESRINTFLFYCFIAILFIQFLFFEFHMMIVFFLPLATSLVSTIFHFKKSKIYLFHMTNAVFCIFYIVYVYYSNLK